MSSYPNAKEYNKKVIESCAISPLWTHAYIVIQTQ